PRGGDDSLSQGRDAEKHPGEILLPGLLGKEFEHRHGPEGDQQHALEPQQESPSTKPVVCGAGSHHTTYSRAPPLQSTYRNSLALNKARQSAAVPCDSSSAVAARSSFSEGRRPNASRNARSTCRAGSSPTSCRSRWAKDSAWSRTKRPLSRFRACNTVVEAV